MSKYPGNQDNLTKEVVAYAKTQRLLTRIEPRNAPAAGIFDEPTRCYVVNEEWAAHIAGAVSTLTEVAAWIGADDERHLAIQSVLEFLKGTVCDVKNCPDVEDCLGLSNIIANLTAVSYGGQFANTQEFFDQLNADYDGTAQSIGPSIPTTVPQTDSLFNNALCYILERIFDVYAGAKGIQFSLLDNYQVAYQNMIQAMRDIVPIVPDFLWYLIGDEIYGCAADVASVLAALADPAAKLEFACCFYEEMRTVFISRANYDAAAAFCAANLTGNAQIIACLFEGDNDLDHYLSFLWAFDSVLVRQNDGEDFACLCVPDGWFWVVVEWDWFEPNHSGTRLSPVFTHTNPSDAKLYSITARYTTDSPADGKITVTDTFLPDALVIGAPLAVSEGYWLWEKSFVGIFEGADAISWPASRRKHTGMREIRRDADETFTFQWKHEAALGHTASCYVRNVRLLYKELP